MLPLGWSTAVTTMHVSFDREVDRPEIVQLKSETITVAAKMFVFTCRAYQWSPSGQRQPVINSVRFHRCCVDVTFFPWHGSGNVSCANDCTIASWAQAESNDFEFSPKKWIFVYRKSRAWRSCLKCRSQITEITSHINQDGNDGNSTQVLIENN